MKNSSKPIVPVEIRKTYFREYLRWQRIEYFKQLDKYNDMVVKLKIEHGVTLAKLNSANILSK